MIQKSIKKKRKKQSQRFTVRFSEFNYLMMYFFPRPTSILEAERGITENRKIQTAVTFFLPKPAQVITNMR